MVSLQGEEKKMKVVNLGVFRTGTTSMLHAFKYMGFKARAGINMKVTRELEGALDQGRRHPHIKEFSGFTNGPWCFIYKDFDKRFDCKFILIIRDEEE